MPGFTLRKSGGGWSAMGLLTPLKRCSLISPADAGTSVLVQVVRLGQVGFDMTSSPQSLETFSSSAATRSSRVGLAATPRVVLMALRRNVKRWAPVVLVAGLIGITLGTVGLMKVLGPIEDQRALRELQRNESYCRANPYDCARRF